MGRRGDARPKPTVDLLIETIGMARMNPKDISRASGCDYQKTAALLASMYRRHILDRDPEGYRPRRYWLPEGDRNVAKRRSESSGHRDLGPLAGPGPRGGQGKPERTRPAPVAKASRKHAARISPSGTESLVRPEYETEVKNLLMRREAINRRLFKLGHRDAKD